MKQAKFLITSANSFGNVGDDICGYGAAYLVKKYATNTDAAVTHPPYREDYVDDADAIVVGGGGVIYDTDMANVENYMNYVDRAKSTEKKAFVLGVGVQGLVSKDGRSWYHRSLSAADLVTVRSPVDERLLRDIGVDNVTTTQDLGFLTDEWVEAPSFMDKLKLKNIFKSNGKPNLGLALVDLVAIKGDSFDEKSANFVDSLESNLARICDDFNVYLLVHSADDKSFYLGLKRRFNLKIVDYKTIRNLPFFWAAYQRLDLVIGSRFHSIVLACLAGKPVIGVSSESTKQNRLANYDMPTLKKQRVLFSEMTEVKDLFENLKLNFEKGRYQPISKKELTLAKRRAHENGKLMKAVINAAVI